jgi:hypothetical protein
VGDTPASRYERPSGPLVSGGWVIACVLASLFGVDCAERAYHRPLCVDACADVGQEVVHVSNGSSGRASLFDNSIHCDCTGRRYLTRYVSWREYFDWVAGRVLAAGALLTIVAVTRSLWRRRRGPPS